MAEKQARGPTFYPISTHYALESIGFALSAIALVQARLQRSPLSLRLSLGPVVLHPAPAADLAPEDAPECLHGHPQHAPSGRGYKLRRTAFSILRARHDQTTSERRDRHGGLIHEYSLAA